MAHFAKLDDNNKVIEVHVVHNNELLDNGVESEAKGIAFLTEWSGGYTNWKQTSYNGTIRGMYAGVGFTYHPGRDIFYPPAPYPSWVLNTETYTWSAPIPRPSDEGTGNPVILYAWNETTVSWDRLATPANATPVIEVAETPSAT
jgi:hypothetical protein